MLQSARRLITKPLLPLYLYVCRIITRAKRRVKGLDIFLGFSETGEELDEPEVVVDFKY